MVREVLLICGIASSLLYVATTILGAMRWKGYSSTSQTVSELSAIGAPSRPLVVPLFLTYSVLVFGALAGLDAPRIEENLPTLRVGVIERVSIFGSLLGFAVLAIRLLRAEGTTSPSQLERPTTIPQGIAR